MSRRVLSFVPRTVTLNFVKLQILTGHKNKKKKDIEDLNWKTIFFDRRVQVVVEENRGFAAGVT